jgi:hypothetical protein
MAIIQEESMALFAENDPLAEIGDHSAYGEDSRIVAHSCVLVVAVLDWGYDSN